MNTLEILEIGIAAAVLFGIIQIGMILAAKLWREKILAWKTDLKASRSTLARLELTIFF